MAAAVATAVGVGASLLGGYQQLQGQRMMIKAQQRAEKLRERQMNLQAMRERREVIRNSILARSTALATTTAQGAAAQGSSALGGAYGQIGGDAGRQTVAINQNQEIGKGIFKANRQYFRGTQQVGMGQAIAGAGEAISGGLTSAFGGKKFMGITIA
jgi:hypothetical protein